MTAAGGGALGLFTAIARLRAVHERIAPVLEGNGLPLLAQHVDAMSTATLVDIFRAEENSCLLGTDAVRDGVDVPGPLAAADRVRPGAVAAARHIAPRPQAGVRRRALRRPHRPAAAAAGLWPAGAPRRRPRRLRDPRPRAAVAPAFGFPEGVPIARVPLVDAAEATRAFWRMQLDRSGPCLVCAPARRRTGIRTEGSSHARPPRRADLHDGDRLGGGPRHDRCRARDHRRHRRASAGVPRLRPQATARACSRIARELLEPRGRAGGGVRRDQDRRSRPICARPPMRSPATSPPPTARPARRSCGCSR